jgi:hypothetical protein
VPKYADESIGFEFEYKVDNATVCAVWPEQLQDSGCDGLDYHNLVSYGAASAAQMTIKGPLVRSLAFLRYDNNSTATLSVVHTPSTKTFISQVEIDDLLAGYLIGIKTGGPAIWTMSGSALGSRYDETEINGVDALRFEVTSDAPRGTPGYQRSRGVGYVLFGKDGQVMMAAATDPQHIRQTRAALESIVKTVHLPPLAQKGFGKASAFFRLLDSGIGLWILALVVAGLFSLPTYFARQKRKRRAQRP